MDSYIYQFYKKQNRYFSETYQKIFLRLKWYGLYRFVAFIAVPLPFLYQGYPLWIAISLSVILFAFFLYLVRKNIILEAEKKKYSILIKIVNDEIKALKHSFLHFNDGAEFIDPNHQYSNDLDLFGRGSLFQFINRTATQSGNKKLASWFLDPSLDVDEIKSRQQSVKELSKKPGWRLEFRAKGESFNETKEQLNEILDWGKINLEFKNSRFVRHLIWILPFVTVISILLALTGIDNLFWKILILCQFLIIFLYRHRISQYFNFFGRKSEILEKYMTLLYMIEEVDFQSYYLKQIQKNIQEENKAGKIFRELKSLVKEFEYRQNFIVAIFLDLIFLWDIRCIYRLWEWHSKYHNKLEIWIDAIAETDAMASLSNYTQNYFGYVFPEISKGEFFFNAKQLGHPLLHPKNRICNDFEIIGQPRALIVTGANMAGKSTFLRTVGVNMVLTRIGAPVCASEFKLSPVHIYTNMRTTDSLLKEESYFFAELKRLKNVMDRLTNGEQVFVILDEMLKGTNSIDKLNGSKQIIRRLMETKAVALIATHDLKLSEMEREFPGIVMNKCFEIRIEENELVFDYKLTNGVTKIMNATFLMKKMGLV